MGVTVVTTLTFATFERGRYTSSLAVWVWLLETASSEKQSVKVGSQYDAKQYVESSSRRRI